MAFNDKLSIITCKVLGFQPPLLLKRSQLKQYLCKISRLQTGVFPGDKVCSVLSARNLTHRFSSLAGAASAWPATQLRTLRVHAPHSLLGQKHFWNSVFSVLWETLEIGTGLRYRGFYFSTFREKEMVRGEREVGKLSDYFLS